jgi:hypothetical protein
VPGTRHLKTIDPPLTNHRAVSCGPIRTIATTKIEDLTGDLGRLVARAPADEHQLAIGGLPLSEDRLFRRKAAGRIIGSWDALSGAGGSLAVGDEVCPEIDRADAAKKSTQYGWKDRSMNLSNEQVAKITSFVNDFGDFFAQDRNPDAMHRCFAVIRHELVDECVPITHPELIPQPNWIDSVLDRIEARRKATIRHIAANMRRMFHEETAGHYLN